MADPLLFAIDVGNSRIKVGLFAGLSAAETLPVCHAAMAFSVHESSPATVIETWLAGVDADCGRAVLGGVNPQVIASIQEGWQRSDVALSVLDRPAATVLTNRTESPLRVGADRLFDAVAANRIRPSQTPAVIVGAGTATTVNLIAADGVFCGGAILAGFDLVASALHERTALLPKIDVSNITPPDPLGRNTEAALRSGLYWGLVGGVKEVVDRLRGEVTDSKRAPLVVLTGGASPLLVPHLPEARWEPHLTLQGIVLSSLLQTPASEQVRSAPTGEMPAADTAQRLR